jgi:hypothetical protein
MGNPNLDPHVNTTLPQEESPSSGPPGNRRIQRRIRLTAWLITLTAGFLQAWASRFEISPDGVNYLDMATALLNWDWQHVVNGYWSPLFPWLLAFPIRLLGTHRFWESTLLHFINFAGLLVALRCFEVFLKGLLRMQAQFKEASRGTEAFAENTWSMLGYGLFLSTSLYLVPLTYTTPDIWVSAYSYLAAGLVLEIALGQRSWKLFAALGIVLGCAYLTKAFYFPMAVIFLATAFFCCGRDRLRLKYAAFAIVMFLLIAGPWIAALSYSKHRPTFGDAGSLNYAMIVDEVVGPDQWCGQDNTGMPKHPVRELYASPQILEFAAPTAGTYSLWFDLSYWMEGIRPGFKLRNQMRVLRQSAGTYFQILIAQIEYAVGLLTLIFLLPANVLRTRCIRKQWYLWLPAFLACAAYSLILVEGRYVAPFALLLWMAAFSCLARSAPAVSGRVITALVLAMVCVTGLRIAKSVQFDLVRVSAEKRNLDWEVAQGLQSLDVRPGDRVSHISAVREVQWARLAGVRIVSGIPFRERDRFWTASAKTKEKVFEILASTGAKVVVANEPPTGVLTEGWTRLGNTTFYAHRLP